ncbi:hypothetical protein PQ478_08755 [Alkalihalophilus pseudofirmus]|uniref:hypothetical protein n=1 Tax=Alkalihalophilus pseudofirmus TaxID=79885 RepID=UPI00259BAF23|nr:hypothetical protein [Alkalihalophilus pseudofirmus]WEG18559.1 hypothetical protein PQ478_08755 [Alkalihalophilus pseudofirmus]
MGVKARYEKKKQVNVELSAAQITQLDFIKRSYGWTTTDAVRFLIRKEALRLHKSIT